MQINFTVTEVNVLVYRDLRREAFYVLTLFNKNDEFYFCISTVSKL
jgi:hypothetical protein